jgi:hypothetical protein
MKIASTQLMRISLLLMVFHFLVPMSVADATSETTNSKETVYQVQRNPIASPFLLKEKEEKKFETNAFENAHVPLLDLTKHGLNLQAQHSTRLFYLHTEELFSGHPSLFTLLQTFII